MSQQALKKWTVATVVAFLLVCPHLRMYRHVWTRYFAFWSTNDPIAIMIVVLGLGSAFFCAYQLLSKLRWQPINRVADAAFVFVLGCAVIAILDGEHLPSSPSLRDVVLTASTWAVVVLAGLNLIHGSRLILRACRAACMIISPVVVIVAFQFLSYPSFSVAKETVRPPGPDESRSTDRAPDVYMFIFDGCSHARTLGDPRLATHLPNLARLAANADVYHDAHSSFTHTRESLPAILWQTRDSFTIRGGVAGFETEDGRFDPVQTRDSLFGRMRQRGYSNAMIGWGHPYRAILGDQLDFSYSAPFNQGNGDAPRFGQAILRHLGYGLAKPSLAIPKPFAIQWRLQKATDLFDDTRMAVERIGTIHKLAKQVIQDWHHPVFSVFHYSVPHPPFIFSRSGLDLEVRDRYPLFFGEMSKDGLRRPNAEDHIKRYEGNLEYMDTLIGEVLDAMASAGKLDQSMIIMTSDHSWRVDPVYDQLCLEHNVELGFIAGIEPPLEQLTHVPLLVKYPFQKQHRDIHQRFELCELHKLIPAAPQTAADTSQS